MGSRNPPGLGMPRLMAFCSHWVLFNASILLIFIWIWFMVPWWLLYCMWMNFWLHEVQRNRFPPWRMQWTMHFLWQFWECWANSWVPKLLNPNMESKCISPSLLHIFSSSSTWNISSQARCLSFQELILKKKVFSYGK